MLDNTSIRNLVIAAAITFVAVSVFGSPPTLEDVIDLQIAEVNARPSDSTVRNDLGNLLVLVERFGEAEEAYRRGLEIDPKNEVIRFNLSLLLQQSGQLGKAKNELESLLEASPNHAWAHYQLGTLRALRGERKSAIESYAQAFAIDPTLSFPSNNPHIIDNSLATEALLVSSRYSRSIAGQMPRAYAEGSRIRGLMLSDESAEENSVDDDLRSIDEMPPVASAPSRQGNFPATGAASLPASPEEEDEADAGGNRVLTNDNLTNLGSVGQSTGGGASRPSAAERFGGRPRRDGGAAERQSAAEKRRDIQRPGAASRNQAPLRSRTIGGSGTSATDGTRTPSTRRRYQPSLRSSAQLRLELLDLDEANTRVGIGP